MFGFFRSKTKRQVKKFLNDYRVLLAMDLDDIWRIEDNTRFLTAMHGWVCKKYDDEEDIERLSYAERVLYFVYQLQVDVNYGGFSEFFCDGNGCFARETAAALREIDADQMAIVCDRATSALGCEIPEDLDARRTILEKAITDEVDGILKECDNEFYKYPEDLYKLSYQFIMGHKTQFAR